MFFWSMENLLFATELDRVSHYGKLYFNSKPSFQKSCIILFFRFIYAF